MERIIFYILALIMVIFAVKAVSSKNMLRSVVYLLFVLMGIAGIYFLMDYSFLAAIQLAVYAGGVIVLIIFSVLLVHHIELKLETVSVPRKIASLAISVLGAGVTLYSIFNYTFPMSSIPHSIEVEEVGRQFLNYGEGGYILPFEVISVLLLVVMIGAIVIAKGKKLENN